MLYLTDAQNARIHKRPCEIHKRGYEIGKMTVSGAPAYSK
jgi:hypothetical protein